MKRTIVERIKGIEYTLSLGYIKGSKNEKYNIDKLNNIKKEYRKEKLAFLEV